MHPCQRPCDNERKRCSPYLAGGNGIYEGKNRKALQFEEIEEVH